MPLTAREQQRLRRLQSLAEQTARRLDVTSRAFARELATVLRALDRRLATLTAQPLTTTSRAVNYTRVALLREEIRQALTAAGYQDLITAATTDPLLVLARDAVAKVTLGASTEAFLAGGLTTRIAGLQRLVLQDLLDVGEALVSALHKAVWNGVLGARSHAELLADLAKVTDKTAAQVRALYDTSVSVYARQVEADLGNAAAEARGEAPSEQVYAYLGPVDNLMRPFCRRYIGRVLTKAEIDGLDNGQLPNVLLTCGGYLCRHVLSPVSVLSGTRELVGTTERIPYIQAQLDALPKRPTGKVA